MRRFILSLMSVILVITVNAQELKVKSIREATHDISARTQARQDLNGVDCALLKVFVVGKNVKFSGNVVDVVSKDNEYWVYLANGTKRVKVTHPDFLPMEITFGDYGINEVNSKTTYVMSLSNGSSGSNAAEDAGGQYLVLNVEPANAIVFIDDSEVTLQNGSYSKFLPYGSHSYKISDPLYTTESGSFDIGMEKKVVNIKLKPAYGVLQISTKPENGAKVYIDNDADPIGITPVVTKKLLKGEHKFRFQKQDYESVTITHSVHDDGSTKPLVVDMSPNYAEVSINASPDCAIYINGNEKGVGKWNGRLTDGMYRLEARKKGHRPTFQNITVVKGVSQSIKLTDPTPIYGSLNVTTNPIGAKIYIDNEQKGNTPDIVNKLLIGEHTIRLEIDGYDTETQKVSIEEGKIKELAINLNKKKPIYVEPKKEQVSARNTNSNNIDYNIPNKSDAAALKAILASKSYYDAERLVKSNLSRLNSPDRATAYNKLVDLAMDAFNSQSTIQTENQLAKQMGRSEKPVNTKLMADMAVNALNAAMECDKYDQQPNEKGKVSLKFAKKNAERLWNAPRFALVNAGQDAAMKQDQAAARKYWEAFTLSDAAPLFKDCNRDAQKAFFGQVARFAAIYAYQDKDMDKALQLCDIAMKDPQEYEGCLNLKLEILGEGLKTKEDSMRYVNQLKEIYAKHQTDGVMEKLFNTLNGMGEKEAANKILDDALAKNPNNFVALADKGLGLINDNPAEAAKYLKRAAALKADNAAIQTYAGTALSVQAQNTNDSAAKRALYREAIKYYDKAKELDPDRLQANWGYNRYNAYYNYYGENAPETKRAEADSK